MSVAVSAVVVYSLIEVYMEFVRGDLIEAANRGDVDVLVHQCNCFNTMGSGIAKSIAKQFPEALLADRITLKGDIGKLGTYSHAYSGEVLVVNVYGQYNYGKGLQTDYEALGRALASLGSRLRKFKPECVVGLPKIGCGLAGGDWEVVKKVVESTLFGLTVKVYEL